MPAELQRLQSRFWQLLNTPGGIEEGLVALSREDPGAVPPQRWICSDDEAGAVKRLDVYAGMYFFRLLDVLRDDYSLTVKQVGDALFRTIVADYLQVHPSENPSVRHVGSRLPAFLKTHPTGDRWPHLYELATLEWERGKVFDAAPASTLTVDSFQSLPAEAWEDLRFNLVPATRLLHFEHNLRFLWDALGAQSDGGVASPKREPTSCIVWRMNFQVWHRWLEPEESQALTAVANYASYAEVCACFAREEDTDIHAVAKRSFEHLQRWVADGLLASL